MVMDKSLKRLYIINTEPDENFEVMEKIHHQLVGNEDYVNSNIILNDSSSRQDGTENEIHLYIFKECKAIPEIII